jgi:adenine phosphoribosyltransferase
VTTAPRLGVEWDAEDVADRVLALIVDVPDFPKPGVLFRDVTPALADAEAFTAIATELAALTGDAELVAGVEARGFLLAAAVAVVAGTGVVPVRKAGKLPRPTLAASYELEYGRATLEVHEDAFVAGHRVLVVDDVLATGGTAAATLDLVEQAGGAIAGCIVLVELSFLGGRERLAPREVHALLSV